MANLGDEIESKPMEEEEEVMEEFVNLDKPNTKEELLAAMWRIMRQWHANSKNVEKPPSISGTVFQCVEEWRAAREEKAARDSVMKGGGNGITEEQWQIGFENQKAEEARVAMSALRLNDNPTTRP